MVRARSFIFCFALRLTDGMVICARRKFRPFLNPARTDKLALKHWVKDEEKKNEYRFAKLNKKVRILDYNDADYEANFKSQQYYFFSKKKSFFRIERARFQPGNEWSRVETDYLFALCRRFDLRWIVIADRFECPEHGASCRVI